MSTFSLTVVPFYFSVHENVLILVYILVYIYFLHRLAKVMHFPFVHHCLQNYWHPHKHFLVNNKLFIFMSITWAVQFSSHLSALSWKLHAWPRDFTGAQPRFSYPSGNRKWSMVTTVFVKTASNFLNIFYRLHQPFHA